MHHAAASGGARPAPMLARQRQEHILERVAATGGVRVADVVEELGISEMTVRRDITELVSQGLVERVHGGAVPSSPTSAEPRFQTKSTLHPDAKRRIGAAGAALVRPGDSLAISGGTTALALARALTEVEHFGTLTVITNSLPAAQLLFDAADASRAEGRDAPSIVLTGGERTPSSALVGLVAVDALRTIRVEWVFLGAHGFTPEAGLMTPNLMEASTNQALAATGRSVVAVLDSSKWGVLGLRSFCHTRDIGVLITESQPDPATVQALDEAGARLVIAT
nr:DeoR/GlpR family DNA-binding transcription regulator [Actinomyces slackii]